MRCSFLIAGGVKGEGGSMKHIKIATFIFAGSMLSLLTGCKEVNEVLDTVGDQVGNILHSDDSEVIYVKEYSPAGMPPQITYEKVFEKYFHNTTWNYFKGKSDEKIVEFTGYYRRDKKDLKFRMQFLLDEDGEVVQEGKMTVNDIELADVEREYIVKKLFTNYADAHGILMEQQKEYDSTEQEVDFSEILREYEAQKNNTTVSNVQNSITGQNNWSSNQVQNSTMANDSDAYVEDDSVEEYYEDDTDDGLIEEDYDTEDSDRDTEGEAYIIPYSDSCYLSEEDIEGFSKEEIRLARNEIYARHGRKFKDKTLQKYFDEKSWYEGEYEPDEFQETWLSLLERKNAAFLLAKEKGKK